MNGRNRKNRNKGGCVVKVVSTGILDDVFVTGFYIKCKKHPYYKAIRHPRVDCQACNYMWSFKTDPQGRQGAINK